MHAPLQMEADLANIEYLTKKIHPQPQSQKFLPLGVVTPERYFGAVVRYAGHSIMDSGGGIFEMF